MGLLEDLRKCSSNGQYWTVADILPYNRPYNFLPGQRGAGKSTGLAIYCILDWLYNKHCWIYTRRTKDETLMTCRDFFDNAAEIVREKTKFIDIKIEYKSGAYYINSEKSGIIIPLSIQYKYKSADLSKYNTIIYDEFLCDAKQGQRYLGGADNPELECSAMLSLFGTVDRGINKPYRNETHVYFCGNAANYAANPFFLQYGVFDELERNPGAKIIAPKNKPWLLQKARAEAVTHSAGKSWQMQLAGDDDKVYIFGDTGTDDRRFVTDIPSGLTTLCNVIIHGKAYIIAYSNGMSDFYCRRGRDAYSKTISCDLLGHDGKIDFEMVRQWHNMDELQVLSNAFNRGHCYFDSVKTKIDFLSYLKYI